jgi:putative copper export protein
MCGSWCRWLEVILLIVIIIFALVQTAASKWLIFVAAIILLIHALFCKCHSTCAKEPVKAKPKARRKRR